MRRARGLIGGGAADAVLMLWAESDLTVAWLMKNETDDPPETFQGLETPNQLIDFLKETA